MSRTLAVVVTCIAAVSLARGESLSQQNLTAAVEVCPSPSSYVNLSIYCVQPNSGSCQPCSALCSECYGPQPDQCYSCSDGSVDSMISTGVLNGNLNVSGDLVLNESRAIYNCSSGSNGRKLSTGAIAGIAVGGAVALVIVIITAVCVCCCLLCRRTQGTFVVGHDEEEVEKARFSQTTDFHPFTNGSGPAKRNSSDLLTDLSKSPDTSNPLYLTSFDASVATFPVKKARSSDDIRESALCDATPPYVYMEAAGSVQPGIATVKSRSLGALVDQVYSEPGQLSASLIVESGKVGHPVSPPNYRPTALSEPVSKFSTLPTSLATSDAVSPDEYVDPRVFRENLDRDLKEESLASVPLPSPTPISRDVPGTRNTRSGIEALQTTPDDFQSRKEFLGSPAEAEAVTLSNEYYNVRDVTATLQEDVNYETINTPSDCAYLLDGNAEEEPTQDCYVEMKPGAELSNADDEYVEIGRSAEDGYVEMQPQFDEPKATPHGYVNLEYLDEETRQVSEGTPRGYVNLEGRQTSEGTDKGTHDKGKSIMSLSKPRSKVSNTKERIMSELYFPPAATSGGKRKTKSEMTVKETVTDGSKVEGETEAIASGERTEESHSVDDEPELVYQNVSEWTSS